MKLKKYSFQNTVAKRLLGLLVAAFCCFSCESSIYSDQSDCPRGLSLRFVYDYNMEYVNSFYTKCECVSVYVFDEFGNYLATYHEIGEKLQDEKYNSVVFEEYDEQFMYFLGIALFFFVVEMLIGDRKSRRHLFRR